MTLMKAVLAAPAQKSKAVKKKKPTPKLTKMEVFRGVKDIWASQVDHRYSGEGVFGKGTYYALNETDAEKYATGQIGLQSFDKWAFVFGYYLTPKNPLKLTPDLVDGLSSGSTNLRFKDGSEEQFGFPSSFPREKLSALAHDSGYDCIILTSDDHMYSGIDGEEQVLIPKGSPLKPSLLWMAVLLNDTDEELAEEIYEKIGGHEGESDPGVIHVSLDSSKPNLKALDNLLKKASGNEADDEDE